MSEGIEIRINSTTHTLLVRGKDVIQAQVQLPGNQSPMRALAVDRDEAAVAICAAFALRHESEGKGRDKVVSPATVSAWLDREPHKYAELEDAVLEIYEAHYVARGKLNKGDLTGKAPAAPAKTSTPPTNGSPSTGSQADGSSTPNSSDG